MLTPPVLCSFPDPQYLFFSENVPQLVYYSHFMIICVAILAAIFVLAVGRKELANKILFLTLIAFALWVVLDSVFWAANNSDVVMFVWSLQILFEPLVYLGSLYLFYILLKKQDVSFKWKVLFLLLYIPVLAAVPTRLALPGFDLSACLSVEGFISIYYVYPLELFYTVILGILAFREYRVSTEQKRKKEIILFAFGAIFFLLAFSWGNIISSFTENWNFAQIGLFAMPVFIGFLVYSIVQFQTFNTKLVGSVFLVAALWLSEFALLFLQTNEIAALIIMLTLVFTTIFGAFLIRGVQREVSHRLELGKLAEELKKANIELKALDQQKTEFLDIASHQLRTPLSALIGLLSMQYDGDFDSLSKDEKREQHKNMLVSAERLKDIIRDFMDAMEVEVGLKLKLEPTAVAKLVEEAINTLRPNYEKKKLYLKYAPPKPLPVINSDPAFLSQVFINLIDNACQYTETGGAEINLRREKNDIVFEIKDTGIGVMPVEKEQLFGKFSRAKRAVLTRPDGSGLGLFIVKKIMEAHGGAVELASAGENKGATFSVYLPINVNQK